MPDVLMPRLSDSMAEGTILRWLKADGEDVRRGEEIVEVETDKAAMTFEAEADGVLRHAAAEGDTLAVGALIATIGEPPAAAAVPDPRSTGARPSAAARPRSGVTARPHDARAANGAPAASPVARRAARELGIDVTAISGSGPYGRVLKRDVVAAADGDAAAGRAPVAAPAASEPPARTLVPAAEPATAPHEMAGSPATGLQAQGAAGARGEPTTVELSRTQIAVARRMSESRATVPDFSISVDVDMGAAIELRAQLKELADPAPSVNDLLVKAVAVTLRRHPRVNGAYRDGHFESYPRVNVGIAVAAEDALVVPTIFDADRLGIGAIAEASRRLAGRVRERSITPPELSGATFTVSNLGMFGVDRFAGVINPPQAGILCAGAIRRRAVVVDDEVAARPVMSLTLVSDHRILYGADAARWLADLREVLERPMALLV